MNKEKSGKYSRRLDDENIALFFEILEHKSVTSIQ